jgi:hypothetical protein
MTLADYIDHLRFLIPSKESSQYSDPQSRWFARVATIKKRQRAYGQSDELKIWNSHHGHKRMGVALPE